MICFERADALHAHEKALRAIQVTDADTLCAYLKGFWEFIYNHKMFGCVYDIYSDDIELYRENGFVLHSIEEVEHETMNLCARSAGAYCGHLCSSQRGRGVSGLDAVLFYRNQQSVQHLRRTHRPETGGRKGHQSQRFPCAENRRRVADCSGTNYAPL